MATRNYELKCIFAADDTPEGENTARAVAGEMFQHYINSVMDCGGYILPRGLIMRPDGPDQFTDEECDAYIEWFDKDDWVE
jgi:hypothetical protein